MATDATLYDQLAALLQYPGTELRGCVADSRDATAPAQPEAAAALDSFDARTRDLSEGELQELYTRTFDTNPATALEVGWHLFGEQYERGAFLVRMRGDMRRFDLKESTELPDHLSHVLAVLGRMDGEEADAFATTQVLPALARMREGVKSLESPYEDVLTAIWLVLTARFGPVAAIGRPQAARFQSRSTGSSKGGQLW